METYKGVLKPAERVSPDPKGGWSGADLDPKELVDNEFISNDPDSFVIEPIGSRNVSK